MNKDYVNPVEYVRIVMGDIQHTICYDQQTAMYTAYRRVFSKCNDCLTTYIQETHVNTMMYQFTTHDDIHDASGKER